jgi:hypothetical protein
MTKMRLESSSLISSCYYERRPPRPPRLPSVLRFNDVKRSSESFKKELIIASKSVTFACEGDFFSKDYAVLDA